MISHRGYTKPGRVHHHEWARYDHQMKRVDVFVERRGPQSSPALVLVHGAPDRSASFRGVRRHFVDRHVVTYDRRGYGRSLHAAPARAMIDHAEDLLAIVDECQVPPVVIAHSFGSNPTMLAVTLSPRAFAAIGLWEPPLPWVEWWPERTKAYNARVAGSTEPADQVEAMYRSLIGQAWDDLSPEVQSQRRAEGAAFQVDMASEIDAPFEFHDVLVPALIGYGTATSAEHIEGAHWLAEQLPNARLRASPGAGHFAPRTHPKEFAAFIAAAMEEGNPFKTNSPS
jgi:pimeloyl-ACP methyl ester carboxylesterase